MLDGIQSAEITKVNVVTDGTQSAEITRANTVAECTHQDRDRAWKRWLTWMEGVGLEGNPYLDGFGVPQKVKLVAGFAISICRGKHSRPGHEGTLVAGTVDKTISCLVTTFRDNNRNDPRLSVDGKTDNFLKSIKRSFKNEDPKENQQKAVTPEILAFLYTRPKGDKFAQHIADICNGAYFFACRS